MNFPKHSVSKPSALKGHSNGRLPDSILENISGDPVIRLLKDTSARAWKAMAAHARQDGIVLSATSLMDSFRPYDVQVRIFQERYTTRRLPGRPARLWQGRMYWQKPGTAAAAVPGTSNHGDALAVDNNNTSQKAIDWLLEHADDYGWSWELDSEPWHLHYFSGDNIPRAVLDFEHSGNNNSEDDEMLAGYDKSPEDVARSMIREFCDLHWGKRQMTGNDQTLLLTIWKNEGREKMMIRLLDDPRNKN